MARETGVLAVFADPQAAAGAVRALHAAGHADVRAAMPAPFPELVEALGRPRSRIGWATLFGGAAGTIGGLTFCIWTLLSWGLVTGGKPIVSLPPFAVVAFELTVLTGTVVNLVAMVVAVSRGVRRRAMPYDDRFSADRIGVFAPGGDAETAETILRRNGAEEVRRVAAE